MPNMTGRPGYRTMEMNGGSSAPYLACTPRVPLFCTSFGRGGYTSAFRLPAPGRDHFHCTVEPSPGHIRCRQLQTKINKNPWIYESKTTSLGFYFVFVSVACCCGLCVPNMTIAKADAKETLGEFICLSITKAKQNLQITKAKAKQNLQI